MAQAKDLKAASKAGAKVGMDEFIVLLNSPKHLAWLNFQTGFMRGVGAAIGAAVALVLLGLVVTYFGGLPFIGEFIRSVGSAAGKVPTP